MSLLKGLSVRGNISCGEPLCRHTTFKIGGPVEMFVEPVDTDDLKAVLGFSRGEGFDIMLIGAGSNILAADRRINRIAVSLAKNFTRVAFNHGLVSCGAGCGIQQFILKTLESGYGGLEFMAGIPGSVGGAITMNAGKGTEGPWISKFIKTVKVMDKGGKSFYLSGGEFRFGYRESNLRDFIVLEAEFKLNPDCHETDLKEEYRKVLTEKMEKQELSLPSAGCVFKNPQAIGSSAGRLIDECGLKGKRVGDAMVSLKHANFIVNTGNATCNDVMQLIELIQKEVSEKFGVMLELEIQIIK